jgi:uncharacterized protein YukJ
MGIQGYGVWVATPTIFAAQRTGKSPHGNLTFSDGTNKYTSTIANINVKSTTTDTRLVYWNDASFTHPITTQLAELSQGFTSLADATEGTNGVRLDLLRSGLETLTAGTVLETSIPGANNDIVDDLTAIFNKAIADKATVYLWGSQYVDSASVAGIHDIHMNQGDSGGFTGDNGIWQDGSFILHFSDGHYEAVFLAFAEQYTQTTDEGQPITTAPTFAQLLNAPDTGSSSKSGKGGKVNDGEETGGAHHSSHHSSHKKHHHHKRHEIYAKRHGESYEESPLQLGWASHGGNRRPSHIVIHDANQKRDMKGWSLVDGKGNEHKIKDDQANSIKNGDEVEISDISLDKQGGIVDLKDEDGKSVCDLIYSRFL